MLTIFQIYIYIYSIYTDIKNIIYSILIANYNYSYVILNTHTYIYSHINMI